MTSRIIFPNFSRGSRSEGNAISSKTEILHFHTYPWWWDEFIAAIKHENQINLLQLTPKQIDLLIAFYIANLQITQEGQIITINPESSDWFALSPDITLSSLILDTYSVEWYLDNIKKPTSSLEFILPSDNHFQDNNLQLKVIDSQSNIIQSNILTITDISGNAQWTPDQLDSLSLWLDASDDSLITKDANDKVSQWNDKSGNNNNLTQTNSSYQPTLLSSEINGLDTIHFDVEFLEVPAISNVNSNYTIFIVSKPLVSETLEYYLDNSSPRLVIANKSTGSPSNTLAVYDGTWNASDILSNYNTAQILCYKLGNNIEISRDGGDFWIGSNYSPQTLDGIMRLGVGYNSTSNRFRGYISGFLIFNEELSLEKVRKVEGYLAHKWGLTDNLPSSHPYKNNPPYLESIWTPDQLDSLSLWFDSSDISTITKDANNNITQWNDKSGNNRHGTPDSNSPIYHSTYIEFNNSGLDVDLDFMAGQSHSFYILYEDVGDYNYLIYGAKLGGNGNNSLHVGNRNYGGSPQFDWAINTWTNDYIFPKNNFVFNELNICNFRWINNSVRIAYVNGLQESSGGSASSIGTMAGGGSILGNIIETGKRLNANVKEIICILNSDITQDNDDKILGYLAHKWGLTNRLPSNHLYKDDPPSLEFTWTPDQLDNVTIWLDTKDESTLTLDGNLLDSIQNKGSYSATFSQTGTNRPTFQSGVGLVFDGSDDYLDINLGQLTSKIWQIFVFEEDVADVGATRYYFTIIKSGSQTQGLFYGRYNAYGMRHPTNVAPSYLGDGLLGYIQTLSEQKLYHNGSLSSTDTTSTPEYDTLSIGYREGHGNYGSFTLKEVVLGIGDAPATEDWQKLEGYLAYKWNLVSNLPSDHPYKNNPPSSASNELATFTSVEIEQNINKVEINLTNSNGTFTPPELTSEEMVNKQLIRCNWFVDGVEQTEKLSYYNVPSDNSLQNSSIHLELIDSYYQITNSNTLTIQEVLLFEPNPQDVLMWLDASDTSTVTTDSNNIVTEWQSKASSGEIAIQGGTPNYDNSLNGKKVVEFDNDHLYIDIPILNATHLTFFIVFKHSNKENGMPSFARSPANLGIHRFTDSDYRCYTNSGNSYSYNSEGNNFTYSSDYKVLGADTRSHQLTTTGTYRICIGGDVFYRSERDLVGSIAEYIIVPYLLPKEYRDRYFGYLHYKWGLMDKLSTNHPYKNNPPVPLPSIQQSFSYPSTKSLSCSYVEFTPSGLLDEFTISLYALADSVGAYNSLFELQNWKNGILFRPSYGQIQLYINSSNWNPGYTRDNNWHHYVLRRISGVIQIIIDKQELFSTPYTSDIDISGLSTLGSSEHNRSQQWDGKISNFIIYKRALLDSEISNLYDLSGISHTDRYLQWDLEEGSGTTANDETSNNIQGTITNPTWHNIAP